jgi:hypothetical protein
MDFSRVYPELKGFSDAVKVGRYAYFSPLMISSTSYSPYLVRLFLGDTTSVGDTIRAAQASSTSRSLTTVLDLSAVDISLRGFSAIVNAGAFIYLVPYRNCSEPLTGQRGQGKVVRIALNDFTLTGVQYVALPVSNRAQIPNDEDTDLRGFSAGFSTGNYLVLVPYYNGLISGKVGRIRLSLPYHDIYHNFTSDDVQVLDLTMYQGNPSALKGFRGGFTFPESSYSSVLPLGVISTM